MGAMRAVATVLITVLAAALDAQQKLAVELMTRAEQAMAEPERATGLLRRVEALLPLLPMSPGRLRIEKQLETTLARVNPLHEQAQAARAESAGVLLRAAAGLQRAGWKRHALRLAEEAWRLQPSLADELVRELRGTAGAGDELRVAGIPAPGLAALAGKDTVLAHYFAAATIPAARQEWSLTADEFHTGEGHGAIIIGARIGAAKRLGVEVSLPAQSQSAGIVFGYRHDDEFCAALVGRAEDGRLCVELTRFRDGVWEPIGTGAWTDAHRKDVWLSLQVEFVDGKVAAVLGKERTTPVPLASELATGHLGFIVVPAVDRVAATGFRNLVVEEDR